MSDWQLITEFNPSQPIRQYLNMVNDDAYCVLLQAMSKPARNWCARSCWWFTHCDLHNLIDDRYAVPVLNASELGDLITVILLQGQTFSPSDNDFVNTILTMATRRSVLLADTSHRWPIHKDQERLRELVQQSMV